MAIIAAAKARARRSWDVAQPALRRPRWLVAWVWRRCLVRTTFIAITGSNGKSTATRFLAEILGSVAPTVSTHRNSEAGHTETIARCIPWKTRYAVIETAAGWPDAIARAGRLLRPDVAVVLSVFLEHRSLLHTLEGVTREKEQLVKGLRPGALAVLNGDDPRVSSMPVADGCEVIRVGNGADCNVRFEDVTSAWPRTLEFVVVIDGMRQRIRTRLLGTHWAGSLSACIAVASRLGVPLEQIADIIERQAPVPGRMQAVRLPRGTIVIRDEMKGTAHTIDVAFAELKKAAASRRVLVFCDLSDSGRGPRRRLGSIGKQAAELVDHVVFVGPHAEYGVQGARRAGMSAEHSVACVDYRSAAAHLDPLFEPDDVVLLKADQNHQLTRLFYSLIGEVRCQVSTCEFTWACDMCPRFDNPELVQQVNEQLTVRYRC